MRDDQSSPAQTEDKLLDGLEPFEVEVVGGLVQERDVKARQTERSQPGSRQLPAGERRHKRPEQVGGGPQGGQAGRRPLLETPRVDLVEPGQGAVVKLLRGWAQVSPGDGGEGRAHGLLGLDHPTTAPQVLLDRLVGRALTALRQVADGGRGRRNLHRAGVGPLQAGQRAQQGRLPGAVRPHHAHALAGAKGQRNTPQHELTGTLPTDVRRFEDRSRPDARDRPAVGTRPQPAARRLSRHWLHRPAGPPIAPRCAPRSPGSSCS